MKAIVQRVTTAKVTGEADVGASVSDYRVPSCCYIHKCVSPWHAVLRFTVGAEVVSEIGRGFCVLLGISRDDTPREAEWMWVGADSHSQATDLAIKLNYDQLHSHYTTVQYLVLRNTSTLVPSPLDVDARCSLCTALGCWHCIISCGVSCYDVEWTQVL